METKEYFKVGAVYKYNDVISELFRLKLPGWQSVPGETFPFKTGENYLCVNVRCVPMDKRFTIGDAYLEKILVDFLSPEGTVKTTNCTGRISMEKWELVIANDIA